MEITRKEFLKSLVLLPFSLFIIPLSKNGNKVGFLDARIHHAEAGKYKVLRLRTGEFIKKVVWADDIEGEYGQIDKDGIIHIRHEPIKLIKNPSV